jgi:hypothetical protein
MGGDEGGPTSPEYPLNLAKNQEESFLKKAVKSVPLLSQSEPKNVAHVAGMRYVRCLEQLADSITL